MSDIIACTGHRPDKLPGGYAGPPDWLMRIGVQYFSQKKPRHVYVGMAIGFDQICAAICHELAIPYTACLPFVGQERRWSPSLQLKYRELLSRAKDVVVVTNDMKRGVGWAMQKRNEYMVDHCTRVCAMFDGSPGGTSNAVFYANMKLRPMDNLWREVEDYRASHMGEQTA